MSLGVQYISDTVSRLKTDDRAITQVVLNSGLEIDCPQGGAVVNCAGRYATDVMSMIGLPYPVESRKRVVFVFDAGRSLPSHLVINTTGVYWRNEGKYFLAGTVPTEDGPSDPDDFSIDHSVFEEIIWPDLAHRIPAFESLKVVNAWAGHYDYNSFDQNAIIGKHPALSNLYLSNGYSGHGLQQSPATGRAVAELMTYGKYQTIDLSRLSVDRWLRNEPLKESNVI